MTCFEDYCEKKYGIAYDFDALDSPWTLSHMLPHRMTTKAHDGMLSADELWCRRPPPRPPPPPPPQPSCLRLRRRLSPFALSLCVSRSPRCNLMRDMLALSDIDPHMLLVVFLPVPPPPRARL